MPFFQLLNDLRRRDFSGGLILAAPTLDFYTGLRYFSACRFFLSVNVVRRVVAGRVKSV
jgi:hypothetical protein